MILILEGPDGGGKSTLAAYLYENKGAVVEHHGPYPGEDDIALHFWLSLRVADREIAKKLGGNTDRGLYVMDRCWISEPIYAKAKERENRIRVHHKRMLERYALSRRAAVVYCLPRFELCLEAWRARLGEEYLDQAGQLKQVYGDYVDAASRVRALKTAVPSLVYNYEVHDPQVLLESARRLAPPKNLGPGLGRYSSRSVVLVGERQNGPLGPFVSFDRSGCSAWLAERLEEAHVSEDRLYWVNAIDRHTGRSTDPSFLEKMSPRAVIALGQSAESWCREAGVECRRVDHPQYWKRFHHHETYPLITTLKEVL